MDPEEYKQASFQEAAVSNKGVSVSDCLHMLLRRQRSLKLQPGGRNPAITNRVLRECERQLEGQISSLLATASSTPASAGCTHSSQQSDKRRSNNPKLCRM